MLYKLSTTLPKNQAITVISAGVIGVSYLTFAALRYSGKDFGGALPGEPKTTSAEWAAASVEYGKVQKANPIRNFRG